MRGRKEAAPGVISTEGGIVEGATLTGEADSKYQFTMKLGPIASILMTGKENALPGREIQRILGLKDGREVTSLIERERRGGVPVCASCDNRQPGYYLPDTPGELEKYIKSLQGRIHEVAATRDALEETLCKWTGQMRLEEL